MKALLLLLSRYPFEEKNRDKLTELIRRVEDWNEATRLINSHGITALAAYNIKEARIEKELPAGASAFLMNGLQQNIIRNIWLKERWKEVNAILTDAGIKHILLKGMALEYTLYGGQGLRQMTDNDVLIAPEDALKAWKILRESGYQTGTIKSGLHKKIMLQANKHLPTLIKGEYAIEIHTRLFTGNKEEPDHTDIIRNAPEIMIDGVPAFVLPEKIHLEYLTSHFENHLAEGECQVRSFADIALLDKSTVSEFPDKFVRNPSRSGEPAYRKAAYRSVIRSVPLKYRFRFLFGDLFPSLKWMKERYNCGTAAAMLRYPLRLGKVGWLV